MTTDFVSGQHDRHRRVMAEWTSDGHLATQTLYDFAVGLLTSSAAAAISQHLEQCPVCAQQLNTIAIADDALVAKLRAAQGVEKAPAPAFNDHPTEFLPAVAPQSISDSLHAEPFAQRGPVANRFHVGLAWLVDPDALASQTVGTPGYMAPEALHSRA